MALQLVDIGANLTHESFRVDFDAVLERARHAGVHRLIVTGADLASSRAAAALSHAYVGQLWSTAGVHPHHAAEFLPAQWPEFEQLLAAESVVAVGECGLDYHRNLSPPDAQRKAFSVQLEAAAGSGKPIFLHQRAAHADFVAMLREFRPALRRAVAHCFTGGAVELEDYLNLDLHIGVTGWVCDERRGQALRDVVPLIPAARLMIETDAPYLLPRDLPGAGKSRRNEPSYLPHIAAAVAALRGETLSSVAALTTRNAVEFFGLQIGE